MKPSALVFIMLLSLLAYTAAFGSEPIRISSTIHPPFSQPELLAGRGHGVMYDLTVEAFKAVNYEATIDFLPMARVVWSLFKGFKTGLDIILANGTFYDIIQKYYGKNFRFEDVLPEHVFNRMKPPE